jgi:AGZA family xanthine/uracil permease-like MFS transporter
MKGLVSLSERGTSVRIEIIAGLTTFLTMAYIIFANPSILSLESTHDQIPVGIERMDKQAIVAATCLAAATATLIVGIFANAPIAMAPGMGLNAYFAYLVSTGQMHWKTVLGAVFLSGLFFLILTILGLRKRIAEAIPSSLISAIAVGIGLFITFIGLKNLGLVVADKNTLVRAAQMNTDILIGLAGLLVMLLFEMKKISGGLLAGIFTSTAIALLLKKVPLPENFISLHLNISAVAGQLDIVGALKWGFFGTIFTLMFMDMFDSIGTLVACCQQAHLVDENKSIKGLDRLLGINAIATMIGAVIGTSTTTAYVESAAGIEQGGRTGLTAVVTAVCFLLALLFVPLVAIVPPYATAPALIMVGLYMTKEVKKIDFTDFEQAFPAFIIMIMIALSYSISTGLSFGFLSFTILKLLSGKAKDIKLAMWIIVILSLLFLAINQIIDLVKSLL